MWRQPPPRPHPVLHARAPPPAGRPHHHHHQEAGRDRRRRHEQPPCRAAPARPGGRPGGRRGARRRDQDRLFRAFPRSTSAWRRGRFPPARPRSAPPPPAGRRARAQGPACRAGRRRNRRAKALSRGHLGPSGRPRLQHCLRATGFLPCPAGSVAAAALICPASTSMSVQHAAIAQHVSSVRRSVLPSLPPSPPRSRAAPSRRRRGRRRMQEPLSRDPHFNVLFQPMRLAATAGARPLGLYRRARPAVTSSDMV